MRLIDADALKNYILINNVGCGCSEDYQKSFLSAVEDQPTVQPLTGHWILIDESRHAKCSECGVSMDLDSGGYHNYCAKCGAKMVTE